MYSGTGGNVCSKSNLWRVAFGAGPRRKLFTISGTVIVAVLVSSAGYIANAFVVLGAEP